MGNPAARAVCGLMRFGLGPRPGDLATAGADPEGLLLSELASADPAPPSALRSSAEVWRAGAEALSMKKAGMELTRNEFEVAFQAEAEDRIERSLRTSAGLRERLVAFWSNHFAVSADRNQEVRGTAGAFEREAIRPHVLGHFFDMLLAVERHPTMLNYLDNVRSFGPHSKVGARRETGLNENLGREILELHTLGVDGGYSQADVTSLARMLTGWSVASKDEPEGAGAFRFRPMAHEPGPAVLMGRRYVEESEAQAVRALSDLAAHPSTARHLARKLAIHFVSDHPPASLTAKLEHAYLDSGGDLAAVTRALLTAPESWEAPAERLRSPWEFAMAALRATSAPVKIPQVLRALHAMGQPLWSPGSPAGFPDGSDAWLSPQGIATRVDIASRVSDASTARPLDRAREVLGPILTPATQKAIAHAADARQGLSLLLLSPEFQRR